MKRFRVAAAAVLVTALALTGCSSNKKETEAVKETQAPAVEAASEAASEAVSEAAAAAEAVQTEAAAAVEAAQTEAAEAVEAAQTEAAEAVEAVETEAATAVEAVETEAEETIEEALTEAEAAIEEALTEAEAILAETEAEKALEEFLTEAEAVAEAIETEAEAVAETVETEAEAVVEAVETEAEEAVEAAETEAEEAVEAAETEAEEAVEAAETEAELVVEVAETEAEEVAVEVAETEAEAVAEVAETEAEAVVEVAETEAEAVVEVAETEAEAAASVETEAEAAEDVMSYDEYMAAQDDDPVVIEAYVQAKQALYEDNPDVGCDTATIYAQDEDGAYFLYSVPVSPEVYEKLEEGTKIRVSGYKSTWAGEVEIVANDDLAEVEIIDGESYVAEPTDVTDLLGDEDAMSAVMNQKVAFKDMTVEFIEGGNETEAEVGSAAGVAYLYSWDGSGSEGDDLYFNASKDGKLYTFVVESYLCGPDSDVYKAVKELKEGDTIDMEGFLYWYEGMQPHITSVTVK